MFSRAFPNVRAQLQNKNPLSFSRNVEAVKVEARQKRLHRWENGQFLFGFALSFVFVCVCVCVCVCVSSASASRNKPTPPTPTPPPERVIESDGS